MFGRGIPSKSLGIIIAALNEIFICLFVGKFLYFCCQSQWAIRVKVEYRVSANFVKYRYITTDDRNALLLRFNNWETEPFDFTCSDEAARISERCMILLIAHAIMEHDALSNTKAPGSFLEFMATFWDNFTHEIKSDVWQVCKCIDQAFGIFVWHKCAHVDDAVRR